MSNLIDILKEKNVEELKALKQKIEEIEELIQAKELVDKVGIKEEDN